VSSVKNPGHERYGREENRKYQYLRDKVILISQLQLHRNLLKILLVLLYGCKSHVYIEVEYQKEGHTCFAFNCSSKTVSR
jgi:sulfur transfer protein SufE